MTDLKPCAHCGGEAELDTSRAYRALSSGNIGTAVAIYCLGCSVDISFCYEDHSGLEVEDLIHMATETWNRRAPVDEAVVERAAMAVYDLDPLFLPFGEHIDGVEIARRIAFDDAPTYRQEGARRLARSALTAAATEKQP